MFLMSQCVFADEMVNVYIFKSSTCPHCAAALEFFDGLKEDESFKDKFQLIAYETNGSTPEIHENINLAEKVSKYFKAKFSGVPLIVIGNQRYEGYASSMDNTLKDRINLCYTSNCTDVVAGIKDGSITASSADTIIVLGILAVIVVGVGYFIYLARKNTEEPDFYEERKELEEKVLTKEKKTDEHPEKKKDTKSTKTKRSR